MAVTEVQQGSVEIEDLGADPPRRLAVQRVRVRAEDMRLGGAPRIRVDASLFPGNDRADAHLDLHIADLGASDREHTPFTRGSTCATSTSRPSPPGTASPTVRGGGSPR